MLLNRPRAVEYMRSCDLDAILVASPVNVRYLSDFHCWLAPLFREYMVSPGGSSRMAQQNFALLPVEGDPALVVEPYFAIDAALSWIGDIRLAGGGDFECPRDMRVGEGSTEPSLLHQIRTLVQNGSAGSPVEALSAAIEDRGLEESRIGIELDGLAVEVAAELCDRLPRAQLLDCTNLLRLIRAVKSLEELDRLEHAASAAEEAAAAAFTTAPPGSRLPELEAIYRARLGDLGVDFDHFAFGVRGLGIASDSTYALMPGDVIYADWGCLYAGYYSDAGTTLAAGQIASDLQSRFEATVQAVQAGADAVRPGVLSSEVQSAMRAAIDEAGVAATYPQGHGFGLEIRDYPILAPPTSRPIKDECIQTSSDLPLEVGMVLNLEASVFVLGRASVHTELSFVVTSSGCRPLTDQKRGTPVIIGTGAARGGP